jgi:hypothetical protein
VWPEYTSQPSVYQITNLAPTALGVQDCSYPSQGCVEWSGVGLDAAAT